MMGIRYSAAWVKTQARMASTSNQETFRAELEGRLVFDILRQVRLHGCWHTHGRMLQWHDA